MKLELSPVSRKPLWPLWAVGLVGVWLCLIITALLLAHHYDQFLTLCLFKRLTHLPCPTCGLTRGGLHLLQGHFAQAWLCNPLLFSLGAWCLIIIFLRVIFARSLRIRLSNSHRLFAWILVAFLVLANWLYVIIYVG
jgi:hypothetical protein